MIHFKLSSARDLILNIESPMNATLMATSFLVVGAALVHVLIRVKDDPKTPSFYAVIGMLIGWGSGAVMRLTSLLKYYGYISDITQHTIISILLCFFFVSGCFYLRFLTISFSDAFWKCAVCFLLGAFLSMYCANLIF